MQLQNEHITWKYLPVGEKLIPQVVCQINDGRHKFTETPGNTVEELTKSIPVDNPYSLILLPPCSITTVKAAKSLVKRVLIVDYNKQRLDEFNSLHKNEFESLLVSDELDFRNKLSSYAEFLNFGKVVSYMPMRYSRLDSHLKYLLSDKLLEVQKEFCSFAVNRTLKRWHRSLNTIENIKNLKPLILTLPNIKKNDAVIVGAGPSLDQTVLKLKDYQNFCTVIATDGSLKTLLKNGVVPDYIVSCEDTLMSWQFFVDSLDQLKSIPLVATYNANHYLLKNYPGDICLVKDSNIENWASEILKPLPKIETGRCVGHLAFNLAIYLNAGRIIMTGFDLAFKGDVFHPADMAVPYFHEMAVPVPVLVKSIYGTMLKTDLSMISYLKDFECMIAALNIKVIDATEGGALKKGTEIKSFEEIDFCENKLSAGLQPVSLSFLNTLYDLYQNDLLFNKKLVESFTSFLVQNSESVSTKNKKDDLETAEELVQIILKGKGRSIGKALVLPVETQNEKLQEIIPLLQNIPVIYFESLSDLMLKVREAEVGHVYCINGQVPPDLMAVYDLSCTDIKTSTERLTNERVLWLEKYEIFCSRNNYDFWRVFTPNQIAVHIKEVNLILKVS